MKTCNLIDIKYNYNNILINTRVFPNLLIMFLTTYICEIQINRYIINIYFFFD